MPTALGLGLALVVTACGGAASSGSSGSAVPGSTAGADPSVVTVTLTDAGCVPDRGSIAVFACPAGTRPDAWWGDAILS